MGLAPYGEPLAVEETSEARAAAARTAASSWTSTTSSTGPAARGMTWDDGEPTLDRVFSDKLEALLGPARQPDEPVTARHEAIAASLQVVFEEAAFHVLNGLHARHEAAAPVSGRRLRDEQRRQRQDSRAKRRSPTCTSSRRRATTAPRSAPRTRSGTRCSGSRGGFVMTHGYWGPAFANAVDRCGARRAIRRDARDGLRAADDRGRRDAL